MGIFKILKIKLPGQFYEFQQSRIWRKFGNFVIFFNFYLILDYYKIRTRTNFENPDGKSLDLRLIMQFMLRELFSDSTDFTEAIFKIPQISKHFFGCALCYILPNFHCQNSIEILMKSHNGGIVIFLTLHHPSGLKWAISLVF